MSRISLSKQIREMGSQELIELVKSNEKYHSWITNCYEMAKTLHHRKDSAMDIPFEKQELFFKHKVSKTDEDACYLICKSYKQLTNTEIINDLS